MTSHSMIATAVLLCGLLGHTYSQGDFPNLDDVLKDANVRDLNGLNIPDLNSLNVSAIPAFEEANNLVKQKCDKNGGEGAFENAKRALDDIQECLKNFVNVTKLHEEMDRYKPTGDLDLVFKKYCRKTPVLRKCVSNFTAAIEPCLEPKEKENRKVIQNITDSLLDFVCYKEGDRIALFISANGPECLQSKQQEIQQCVNTTFGSYIPPINPDSGSLPALDSLPNLVFGTKECTDIATVQSCVVKKLEQCTDPTPANIVDSIFNFIIRVTPCKDLLTDHSAASTSTISLLTASIVFLVLRLI